MTVEKLITDHIDIWSSALQTRSMAGSGSNGKIDLYGIKKLRELILELAVRGKLVPQDPNDEPASELLKRIAAEKAELVKQGKIKKQKPLPEISEDEKPFELPKGWVWVRLGELFNSIASGGTPSKSNPDFWNGDIPWASVKDLGKEKYIAKTQDYISHQGLDAGSKLADEGDILICTRMGLGKIGIASCAVAFNQDLKSVKLTRGVSLDFFFNTYSTVKIKGTGTTVEGIKQEQLLNYVIGLPSGNEQHQIVEKVDELMSLCDQLEQQSLTSLDAHQQLVETLLTTLTDSQNAEELAENWARISQHFDTLFTTEASIDALKQTILQLAVMGKLVPQDPNDEPVNNLLERVKLHQFNRIKNKEIQKPKIIGNFLPPDISIPETSSFMMLNQLAFVTKLAGFEYTNYLKLDDSGEVPVVRAQNVKPFKLQCNNLKYTSLDISKRLNRSALTSPCLLMTFIGAGVGETCIFDDCRRWHLAPNVAKIEPFADLDIHYMNIYLNSNLGRSEIFKSLKATAQPSLSMATIREIVMVIPPLEEQKRIVLKTNSLLSICDTLKSRLQSAQQTQLHLADALTDAALN